MLDWSSNSDGRMSYVNLPQISLFVYMLWTLHQLLGCTLRGPDTTQGHRAAWQMNAGFILLEGVYSEPACRWLDIQACGCICLCL